MGTSCITFICPPENQEKDKCRNKEPESEQPDIAPFSSQQSPEKPPFPDVNHRQIQGAVRGFITRKQNNQPLLAAKEARAWLTIDRLYPKAERPISEVQNRLIGLLEDKLDHFEPKRVDDGVKTVSKPAVKLTDGAIYEGEWDKNGKQHGIGTLVKEDGSKVFGVFKAGMVEGMARMIQSTGLVYEGEFKNGEMNGNGKIQNKTGGKFNGELVNGKIHGKGAEEWPDGTKYEGEYKKGVRHGSGILHLPDGSTYNGKFKDGAMCGEGELRYKNGNSYSGGFKDNKMHGKGVFLWNDGRKYEGEFREDVKSGKGVMSWSDGKVYDGHWVDGVQNGEAIYTFKNREGVMVSRKSKWENGTRVEWIDN